MDGKFSHYLVLDRLILEYPKTIMWLGQHGGDVRQADYKAAERAVSVSFDEDFAKAERFFGRDGVRRAMVAYWADALADLRERGMQRVSTQDFIPMMQCRSCSNTSEQEIK